MAPCPSVFLYPYNIHRIPEPYCIKCDIGKFYKEVSNYLSFGWNGTKYLGCRESTDVVFILVQRIQAYQQLQGTENRHLLDRASLI